MFYCLLPLFFNASLFFFVCFADEHGHLKIYLPKKLLECLPKCSTLPKERHRWNTNEEIAAYLITFEKHEEWLTTSPKTRPQNGSMILYNRKKVKYRKDGYCWKKRKDGKTTREDHMKLKVQGVECLYGCYVHSSIIPTFHRRCYWLLQVRLPETWTPDCGKPCGPILCSINTDKKEWAKWTKEELIGQLKPMFHGIKWTCSNGNSSSGFSVEQLVQQILDSHQTKPPPRTHNCLCTGTLGAGSSVHHKCNSAKHRIISPKVDPRSGGYSSTHSELQNNDVSEGKTEHSHSSKNSGGTGGGSIREKRNGKVHKPVLLHQNSTEVSSTNQVEVPDTTQNSPVSISSGLNSDPDMADSPAVTGMGHVASVMSSLSQSVFMSEVTGDPVYSMSPTGGHNTHIMGPDATSHSLVLGVTSDSHKFAFPGSGNADTGGPRADGLSMLSASGVSDELVLSNSLDSSSIKIPEATMNFDPDCFLNNPKQGQTYGGNGLKQENASTNGLQRSPTISDSNYGFSSALVKNIKTEDTSFEQQLAKEGRYQVGPVVSCSISSGSGSQNSLTLTPASSLLPSGGGLSPSTTLEQMDFSAIDAKQDYSAGATAVSYSHALNNLAHQNRSPSFFLQEAPQTAQNQQGRQSSSQKGHLLEHNTGQHRPNCNGGSPTEGQGQTGSLQLLQYQGGFPGLGPEHEEVVGMDQNRNVGSGQSGATENGTDGLLKSGDHLQACGGGSRESGGADHFMQQSSENRAGAEPLLQGANLVQGLYNTHHGLSGTGANGGGGTGMEISLDHFDISFGNQFSDLINDFISVDSGATAVGAAGTLYTHQLVAPPGSEGAATSGGNQQQGHEDAANRVAGYSPSELCLQSCCSPQSLGGGAGGGSGETGSLAYMHVAEVVSAAVAQGTLGMLQATGRLFMVTDYSPEWSYPEGGVKVLITGPWQEDSSSYTCLFDQISVPASLIQPGVLRCYCPAHDTGLVTLQVAVSNQIISNSIVFEYKARALPSLPSSQHDWLSLDDNQFRMSILERLEQMERRMAEMAGQQQQGSGGTAGTGGGGGGGNGAGSSFESRVVVVCEKMMNRACWAKSKHLIHSKTFRGMTLLHLAAGQGYATLIQTLIKWRTKHADSIDLELEVDPLNVDHFSCTPLMWACALGHLEAAVVLYKWDRRALAIPDSLGRLPLSIARSRGHTKLAECLEQLQKEEQQQQQTPSSLPPTSSMSFSPNPDIPTSNSWMVSWSSDSMVAPSGQNTGTATTTTTPLPRKGGISGVGKEKLASRLRQRGESLSMLGMVEREMVDTEILSYKEDLENQDCLSHMEDLQANMMSLAEHIIEATPERIKQEHLPTMESVPLDNSGLTNTMSWLASYLGDVEHLPSIIHLSSPIYSEPLTPPSNPILSPGNSPMCEGQFEKPTLPAPSEWSEFLRASNSKVERELAQLTLSDPEQRELYEAARLVQTAFRKYKGRPLREQQEVATAVIQRCYRKYKQYALYKKMTQAAILIQSKFRSYHEQKKFQQSRRAAVLIQQCYRSYREFGRLRPHRRAATAALVQHKLRSSLLTKRQDQAARKIMRFLRRCRHRYSPTATSPPTGHPIHPLPETLLIQIQM
uniref:Calmodulin-binding transcription activator 1 n=1 Tax=Sinocyclocheilus anshuiensis TaxID=1608454 RepID=A0A671LDH6_9TELE